MTGGRKTPVRRMGLGMTKAVVIRLSKPFDDVDDECAKHSLSMDERVPVCLAADTEVGS